MKRCLTTKTVLLLASLVAFCLTNIAVEQVRAQTRNERGSHNAGFSVIQTGSGVKVAVWYPTSDPVKPFRYSKDGMISMVATNGAPLTGQERFPLIVFSHGYMGGALQSIFFTEELARHGYVVAAPDHKDAALTIDGKPTGRGRSVGPNFLEPQKWNVQSYADRRSDLSEIISYFLSNAKFNGLIDPNKIGGVGHSIGGYTVLAMCGAWPEWKDQRIKVALLMSPYIQPFLTKNTIQQTNVPVMYQGAFWDLGITPSLRGANGAYARSNSPKYYLELNAGNHFEWTNLACAGNSSLDSCLEKKKNVALINQYGIAFLDKYLKGKDNSILTRRGANVAGYQFEP